MYNFLPVPAVLLYNTGYYNDPCVCVCESVCISVGQEQKLSTIAVFDFFFFSNSIFPFPFSNPLPPKSTVLAEGEAQFQLMHERASEPNRDSDLYCCLESVTMGACLLIYLFYSGGGGGVGGGVGVGRGGPID